MTAALRAEFLKITTTRRWWIIWICVFVLGGGYAVLPAVVALLDQKSGAPSVFGDPGLVHSIYNGGNTLCRVLAMVVGIASLGSEHRHHTLATTYLATPQRIRVLLAKAGAVLILGLLYGLTSVLAGFLVAVGFVTSNGGSLFLDRPETWRSLSLGVLAIALWTMIGMGIGTLIKNLFVAMLVGISFAYLVEPVVSVIFFYQKWFSALNLMPTGATNAMLGATSPILFASEQPTTWWQAAAILLGWCLVPAVVGVVSTMRRDIAD